MSIAVLHHISSRDRRLQLLSELTRIVRPGGVILVCAWAIEQEKASRRQFDAADVLVPWHVPLRFVSGGAPVTVLGSGSDPATPSVPSISEGSQGASSCSQTSGKAAVSELKSADGDQQGSAKLVGVPPPVSCTLDRKGRSIDLPSSTAVIPPSENLITATASTPVDALQGSFDSSRQTVVFERYCHLYQQGELEELISAVPAYMRQQRAQSGSNAVEVELAIEEAYYDKDNWCVRFRRLR